MLGKTKKIVFNIGNVHDQMFYPKPWKNETKQKDCAVLSTKDNFETYIRNPNQTK